MKVSRSLFQLDAAGSAAYRSIHCAWKAFTCESHRMFPKPPPDLRPMAVSLATNLLKRRFWSLVRSGSLDHHSMSASDCTMLIILFGIFNENSQ